MGQSSPVKCPVIACLKPLLLVYSSHFESVSLRLRRDIARLKSHSMVVTLLEPQPVYPPESWAVAIQIHREKRQETRSKLVALIPQGPLDSPAPPRPYLEQCSCHVEDNEDESEGGVSALHTADGVEEHQVSWDHKEEEDPG